MQQYVDSSDMTLLGISVSLSKEGLNHVPDILNEIFAYLKLVLEKGVTKERYNEYRTVARMNYIYNPYKQDPFEEAPSLTYNLRRLPLKYVVAGSSMYAKYDQKMIENIVEFMSDPANAMYLISSKDFKEALHDDEEL